MSSPPCLIEGGVMRTNRSAWMASALVLGVGTLVGGALLCVFNGKRPEPEKEHEQRHATPDDEALQEAGIDADDATLLNFLRDRSNADEDLRDLDAVVRRLGSDSFRERKEASDKLTKLELVALPLLYRAKNDPDLEVVTRATECIERIQKRTRASLPLAAVRLLLRSHPAGTVETLVRYLPYAGDDRVVEETYFGLEAAAARATRIDPSLVDALTDVFPARRALAGCLAARWGNVGEKNKALPLLMDDAPLVRLRTAQGFLAAGVKEAIPTLIGLLNERSPAIAWQAEELLVWAAGDQAPEQTVGSPTEESAKQCQAAWQDWWKNNQRLLDLGKRIQTGVRPMLALAWVEIGNGRKEHAIRLYGSDGWPHWQLAGLGKPTSFQFVGEDRLLLAEDGDPVRGTAARVSERYTSGDVAWTQRLDRSYPGRYRRLPGGNTLIAGIAEVEEWDAERKPLYRYSIPSYDVRILDHLQRMTSGRVLCSSHDGKSVFDIDLTRSVGTEKLPGLGASKGACSIGSLLSGDLIVVTKEGDVIKIDPDGRNIWQCAVTGAWQFCNGSADRNIAVTGCRGNVVRYVEIDATGKPVVQLFLEGNEVQPCLPLMRVGFHNPIPTNLDDAAVRENLAALRSDSSLRRKRAALFLQFLGRSVDVRFSSELLPALADDDATIRHALASILKDQGEASLPILLKGLEYDNVNVKIESCLCIGQLRSAAQAAVPALIRLLHDKNTVVRGRAAITLGLIGPSAKEAVLPLINAFQAAHADDDIRHSIARALWLIGPEARAACPLLIKAMADPSESVGWEAARALGSIGVADPTVLPSLRRMLRDRRRLKVCAGAAFAISMIGSRAADAVPDLIDLVRYKLGAGAGGDDGSLAEACSALGSIGRDAKQAIPELIQVVKSRRVDFSTRACAAKVLGEIGVPRRDVTDCLVDAGTNQDDELRSSAINALIALRKVDE
jgi:HEAT repeat protein